MDREPCPKDMNKAILFEDILHFVHIVVFQVNWGHTSCISEGNRAVVSCIPSLSMNSLLDKSESPATAYCKGTRYCNSEHNVTIFLMHRL